MFTWNSTKGHTYPFMFDLSAMLYLATHGLPLVAWLLSFLCNSCLTEFNDPLSSLKFTKKNKSKRSKIHLLLGLGFTPNVWREMSMLSVFEIQTAFLISYVIKLIKIMRQHMIFKRAMNPFLIWTKYASNNTIVVILSYY